LTAEHRIWLLSQGGKKIYLDQSIAEIAAAVPGFYTWRPILATSGRRHW